MKKSTKCTLAAFVWILGAVLTAKELIVAFPNHPWVGWLTGAVLLILLIITLFCSILEL